MIDYLALKAAAAALTGSDADVLALLAAQTAPGPTRPTSIVAMQSILLAAPTADWAKVVLRSRMTPSGIATDGAIMAAITAVGLVDSLGVGGLTNVDTTSVATAAQLDAMLGGLQAVGDLSAASVAAIQALRAPLLAPVWPHLTIDDLIAARVM